MVVSGRLVNKIFWDFKIQTEHLISARRPDRVLEDKKKNLPNIGFCRSGWLQIKTDGRQKER